MKKLYYVRHGETEMNAAGILSGRIDTSLTLKGIEQAKAAGRQIARTIPRIDAIICSPYERTRETAKLIAVEIGFTASAIQANDMLVERTFGVLEGTSGKDFLANHAYSDFDTVDGAETVEDLQKRAEVAFAWLKTRKEDTILVVGHGAFGRAITRVARGEPYTREYEVDTTIGNAAIVQLV